MKKLITIHIVILIACLSLQGQNRLNYSQYMVNQGVYNPGYYNSLFDLSGNIYYRKQWLGIEGSPTTKSLVVNYNLGDRHGLKLNIYQDNITVFSDLNFGLGYNWRTYTGNNSMLSLGILADYGIYSAALGGVNTQMAGDPAFGSIGSSYINVGTGAYWESSNFYMGLSAPYLFNNSKNAGLFNPDILFNHVFYTLGSRVEMGDVQFFPTGLAKVVWGSPIQFDVNANFLYRNKIWYGGGYRNDNTFIFMFGMVFYEALTLMYSYDLALLAASNTSSGSHEITLGYGISFYGGDKPMKRRYFKRSGGRMKAPKIR